MYICAVSLRLNGREHTERVRRCQRLTSLRPRQCCHPEGDKRDKRSENDRELLEVHCELWNLQKSRDLMSDVPWSHLKYGRRMSPKAHESW